MRIFVLLFACTISLTLLGQTPEESGEPPAGGEKASEIFDEQAEFPGGLRALGKFLARKLKYPRSSRRQGIEGRVYVTFIIDTDGTMKEPKVVKGLDEECNKEAIRLISIMPPWIPAKVNSTAVKSRYVLQINFDLDP